MLAGSELMDVLTHPGLMEDLREDTGVTLVPTPVGTLAGAEAIVNGVPQCAPDGPPDQALVECDLAWFSSNHYMDLLWDEKTALDQGAPEPWAETSGATVRSPVVLGVRSGKAQELGWTDTQTVPWSEIAAQAAAGRLSFFMTNPAVSNSGFSALVGVASAFDTNEGDLDAEDVDTDQVSGLFSGLVKTAGSSGWLSDELVRSPGEADAIINYESEVRALRSEIPDLVTVYPERTVYADYPLTLLDPRDAGKYAAVVDWLCDEATQRVMTVDTYHRPCEGAAEAEAAATFTLSPAAVPLPDALNTAEGLIDTYLRDYRDPPHTLYVLDTSRSMQGTRIAQLRQAFGDLVSSSSGADRFTRFREGERVTVIPYDTVPADPQGFDLESPDDEPQELAPLTDHINGLVPDGDSTAVYKSVLNAYGEAEKSREERYYQSIVLLTDGENNEPPATFEEFADQFRAAGYADSGVPTFVVMLGDDPAAQESVERIAELTGGRVFDASSTSMIAAFREIRGYS